MRSICKFSCLIPFVTVYFAAHSSLVVAQWDKISTHPKFSGYVIPVLSRMSCNAGGGCHEQWIEEVMALGRENAERLVGVRSALVGFGQGAQPKSKANPGGYAQKVRPLLAKYCFACHDAKKPKGGLNLAALRGQQGVLKNPKMWQHVWNRLHARQMPPSKYAQPTAAERNQLTTWIETALSGYTLGGHRDPGPLRPRRLNVREYMNTLRDLVITKGYRRARNPSFSRPRKNGTIHVSTPAEHPCAFVTTRLPQDTNDGGFDTISENLSIPRFHIEKYFRCTDMLLDDLFTAKAKDKKSGRYHWRLRGELERTQKKPLPRGVKSHREAVERLLQQFAAKAFRRPVTAKETERYLKLYDLAKQKGDNFEDAIRLPLTAILVSPRFVILWSDAGEVPQKDAAPVRPLNGYEMANRLAYFLWSSIPDGELIKLAEQGKLQDSQVIEKQARIMLKDRRVTNGLLKGFLCQWLELDRLQRAVPDATRYPVFFKDNLQELMRRELVWFVDAVMCEDRSILEFLDADFGFLCRPLADHYGIKDFPGRRSGNGPGAWYRWKFKGKRRGGVLTMGAVLTGTSQPRRTSPVARGKWVLETILGTPPPPPPADVNNLLAEGAAEKGKKQLTVPQMMARHRNNAACYSCHRMIDPLGVAFENFDPVGRWRDTDQGHPVDARDALVDGTKFNGIEELKAVLLARKDDFTRCFVEKMLTYALGRKLEFYDMATVKEITQAVARDNYKFSRVVVEIVKSYPFRYRRTASAKK